MTKKKEESKNTPLAKIKFKQVGRSFIALEGTTKYVLTFDKEDQTKLDKLKKEIESYNKLPNESKYNKLIATFTKTSTEKKAKTKASVKKVKHDLAEVKNKSKKANKEMKQLKASMGNEGDRFVVRDGKMYLNPYMEVPLPDELMTAVKEYIEMKVSLEPLINFWMLALLNPNKVARAKLFGYLSRQKLILTPHGYFVTYRMVKTHDASGNELPKGIYTDAHTKTMRYEVGKVQRIPRSQCDEDGTKDCSRGLHTGTPDFIGIKLGDGYSKGTIHTKAQGGGYGTGYDAPSKTTQDFDHTFGNQAIITLINPMHVVSIPNSDTRKMRSCEFFFWKLTTAEEVLKMNKEDYLIAADEYHEYERAQLEEMLKKTKLENYVEGTAMKGKSAEALRQQLDELKNSLNISGDSISESLTFDQINDIVQSRIKPLQK